MLDKSFVNKSLPPEAEAKLDYRDGDYRILKPGLFVRCAISGVPILLDDLRYWDVDKQCAYANPQAVMQAKMAHSQ